MMRYTISGMQSPQASASTNSAIRAVTSVVDGVSQENEVESSGAVALGSDTHDRDSGVFLHGQGGCTDSIRSDAEIR